MFDDEKTGALSVFYRGEIAGIAATRAQGRRDSSRYPRFPGNKLPDFATQSMLRRYVSERSEDRFGIYVGTSETGTVRDSTARPDFRRLHFRGRNRDGDYAVTEARPAGNWWS